ncbi:MAG: porin family protein [candidate division Zixibacteria bacterium]|nr:porin family protein [candidate division Zixibacteria bacterium]
MKALHITIILVVLLAVGASAQLPSKPFNIYAGGGVTLPNQPADFKDVYNMGFHGFVGMGLNVSPMIQMVGKIGYHNLGLDSDVYAGDALGNVDGGSFTVLSYGVDARMAVGAPAVPIKPFGFIGLGMANLNLGEITSDSAPEAEFTSSKLYYNFGAGLEFKRGPGLTFFVQAAYMSIAGDADAVALGSSDDRIVMIPISLGVKF